MNLATDKWFYVLRSGKPYVASLYECLSDLEISEFYNASPAIDVAQLSIAASLAQVIIAPTRREDLNPCLDEHSWTERLSRKVEGHTLSDMFDAKEFMQQHIENANRDARPGVLLPNFNEDKPFSSTDSLDNLCATCAISLLYDLFSFRGVAGKYDRTIRMLNKFDASITALIVERPQDRQPILRNTILYNICRQKEAVLGLPTWIDPPKPGEDVRSLGLLRKLFWNPTKVRLNFKEGSVVCDSCNQMHTGLYISGDQAVSFYSKVGSMVKPTGYTALQFCYSTEIRVDNTWKHSPLRFDTERSPGYIRKLIGQVYDTAQLEGAQSERPAYKPATIERYDLEWPEDTAVLIVGYLIKYKVGCFGWVGDIVPAITDQNTKIIAATISEIDGVSEAIYKALHKAARLVAEGTTIGGENYAHKMQLEYDALADFELEKRLASGIESLSDTNWPYRLAAELLESKVVGQSPNNVVLLLALKILDSKKWRKKKQETLEKSASSKSTSR